MSESSRPSATIDTSRSKAVWGGVEPRRNFLTRLAAITALFTVPRIVTATTKPDVVTIREGAAGTEYTDGDVDATPSTKPVVAPSADPDPFSPAFKQAFATLSLEMQVVTIELVYAVTNEGRRARAGLSRDEWGPMDPHEIFTAEQLPVAIKKYHTDRAEHEAKDGAR